MKDWWYWLEILWIFVKFCYLVSLKSMTKSLLLISHFLLMSALFPDVAISTRKMVFLCSCNWSYFHLLTSTNLYYIATEMFMIQNWWYMTSFNEWWRHNSWLLSHFLPFLSFFFYQLSLLVWTVRGFGLQIRGYSSDWIKV